MLKFCRRCGAELQDGAKFCRQCGASTTPTQVDIQADPQGSNPLPTTPLDKTELMTSIMPEPTQILSQPQAIQSLQKSSSMKWIWVVGLLVVVAAGAFLVGSRMNSSSQQMAPVEPAASLPPPNTPNEVETPPSPASVTIVPTPKKPEPPKDATSTSSPKGNLPDSSTVDNVETALPDEGPLKRGTDYLNAQQYDLALQEFEKLRHAQPGNKDVYYLIGQAYHQLGQLELALQAYEKCTSGPYSKLAQQHVEKLQKKLRK